MLILSTFWPQPNVEFKNGSKSHVGNGPRESPDPEDVTHTLSQTNKRYEPDRCTQLLIVNILITSTDKHTKILGLYSMCHGDFA